MDANKREFDGANATEVYEIMKTVNVGDYIQIS